MELKIKNEDLCKIIFKRYKNGIIKRLVNIEKVPEKSITDAEIYNYIDFIISDFSYNMDIDLILDFLEDIR